MTTTEILARSFASMLFIGLFTLGAWDPVSRNDLLSEKWDAIIFGVGIALCCIGIVGGGLTFIWAIKPLP